MTQIRDQIREIVQEEVRDATILALENTPDTFSDTQEARIRQIIAEELVAAFVAPGEAEKVRGLKKPDATKPSANLSKRGRPLSMTPAAVYQRKRREDKKRGAEVAKVEAMQVTENVGEAVAQAVTEAMQGSSNPSPTIVVATPQNGSSTPSSASTESAGDLGLNI